MRKIATIALIGVSALTLSAGAAAAQSWRHDDNRGDYRRDTYRHNGWTSIDARQAMLDRRIDQGVMNGALTRREAMRLRAEFREVARLEYRYRVNGLSGWERDDLDRRFDRLAMQIRMERRDGQRDYGYGYGGYRR